MLFVQNAHSYRVVCDSHLYSEATLSSSLSVQCCFRLQTHALWIPWLLHACNVQVEGLLAGQLLTVPSCVDVIQCALTYTVMPGDTLYRISEQFRVS